MMFGFSAGNSINCKPSGIIIIIIIIVIIIIIIIITTIINLFFVEVEIVAVPIN